MSAILLKRFSVVLIIHHSDQPPAVDPTLRTITFITFRPPLHRPAAFGLTQQWNIKSAAIPIF